MGTGRTPQAADIQRAIRLSRAITASATIALAAVAAGAPRR
jgi:cobalamin biosynthesis protein CobD/CbiB